MNILRKIAFATVDDSDDTILSLAYRSSGVVSNTGTLCVSLTPDTFFYIYSSTKPVITTGDIAYNTNNLTSPFNGANKFYNVAYSDFVADDTYIVQINSSGVMTVIDSCSI